MPPLSLTAGDFIPTTSFSGGEPASIFRGSNVVVRGLAGRTKIENYPGSKDLSENYDISSDSLTGSITFTAGSDAVTGSGTAFEADLHIGQWLLSEAEVLVVKRIVDDTHFINDRPCTTSGSGKGAIFLWVMNELEKQRAVQRRGNVITQDKKDRILVGAGVLYINGVSTGFTATRSPKRLQRETDGTYTEMPIGLATPPPMPVITVATGGSKGMQAGSYSAMFSWYNSVTKGFSNPTEVLKLDGAAAAIVIAAGGRFDVDFTTSLLTRTFIDGDVTIATGNINDVAHGLVTGDAVKLKTTGALPVATTGGGLTALKTYYVIRIDADNLKLARTAALALAGTAIVYSSAAGGGTHSIYKIPANADGFIYWGSQSGGGVAAVNLSAYNQGAWYDAQKILLSDLDANDKVFVEYLDAELGAVASGDNDAPPDCEFVTEFANTLHYISALGKKTASKALGSSPGNYVLPTKASNREAAPADWRVSVGDEITGFANGVGRLFCLTPTGLPFVTPTGRTELARLAPTLLDVPFSSRPFWTKGGISPYNVIVVQGDVFTFTGKTLLRSPSNADTNVIPFELGLPIEDLTKEFFDGFILLGHCPKNQQVCVIASATRQNDASYWITEILPYDLRRNTWMPVITLSSTTRDMIVSGVATVGGRMEFLAGGRRDATTAQLSTFRYDEPAGVPVPYYFATQPADFGSEEFAKMIKYFRLTGRVTSFSIQIHGARGGGEIDIDDIEAGTNSLTGNITLPDSTSIEHQFRVRRKVKRLRNFSIRGAGTWDGTGEVDRIDELVVEISEHGGPR